MAGFALHKNTVFDWNGAEYRIARLQPNGELLIERVGDGSLSIVTRETILSEYGVGNVSAKPAQLTIRDLAPLFSRPLDELSESVRCEALRRRRYIEHILGQGAPVFTAT